MATRTRKCRSFTPKYKKETATGLTLVTDALAQGLLAHINLLSRHTGRATSIGQQNGSG